MFRKFGVLILELCVVFTASCGVAVAESGQSELARGVPIPDKTVVLTFDDAVKSQHDFVAPLLKELGFGATFFISARWMEDAEHFMTWQDAADLHAMGFEIGNHTWNHGDYGTPRGAARLAGELALVDSALEQVKVPQPTSFAWCGNGFGPEARTVLKARGYRFARRGMQPEVPYGEARPGPAYRPDRHEPLLIPTAGDAYPNWTLENFIAALAGAKDGAIAVLQFHGVPDVAHPWVNTPADRFSEYMHYLKDNGYNVIAVRDLARYVDPSTEVADAMKQVHYTGGRMDPPVEVEASRANPAFWLGNMIARHHYAHEEAAQVLGWPVKDLEARLDAFPVPPEVETARILPYPGGRHPRIGFLEGCIDPMRGTKASVFSPWADGGYAVVDVPEAVFSGAGLLFLGHTHVPTIWDKQHIEMENHEWSSTASGGLENIWTLPNGVKIGAELAPLEDGASIELWLENGSKEAITGLRTQVCILLKGLPGFEAQDQANKVYGKSRAGAQSSDQARWVTVEFDHCGRTWGNPKCPCIHADPVLPDCAAGARVSVQGRLSFLESSKLPPE